MVTVPLRSVTTICPISTRFKRESTALREKSTTGPQVQDPAYERTVSKVPAMAEVRSIVTRGSYRAQSHCDQGKSTRSNYVFGQATTMATSGLWASWARVSQLAHFGVARMKSPLRIIHEKCTKGGALWWQHRRAEARFLVRAPAYSWAPLGVFFCWGVALCPILSPLHKMLGTLEHDRRGRGLGRLAGKSTMQKW